ncbi:hypothetical protein GCM10025880_15120 [Methylorubrum aminovorans]|nr:hypothetical protein GCM10025880_15120 [Methylorubrum aminovorans]
MLLAAGVVLTVAPGTIAAAQAQATATLDEISVTSVSPVQARPAAPVAPAAAAPFARAAEVLPVATSTFSPVTVVPQERIARDQPRTLGDALFDRPGISASTYAPGAASRPIIRGLDNARVRIQENGIVNGGVSDLGEDHAVPVNPLNAGRIEVIRGPATLRYGSGAIGGVVSVENNQVPTFIPARGVTGQVTTGYTTVDNGRLGAASVDAGADGIAVHADGFKTATDSYAIPGGIQRNSATESQGGSVGISAVGERGFLGLSYSHYDAIYQIPGGEAEEARTRLTPNQDRLLARGEVRPLNGPFEVLRFWAGGSVYRHEEIGIGEDGVDGVQAIFKNREVEARFEAQHVPVVTALGTLTGAVGVQAGRRVLNSQLESFLPQTESRMLAGYLFEELAVGNGLRFQAAGRIEGDRLNSIATQFPASYLPTDGDPASYALTRRFAPKSASLGALQDLPYGFVASLNGSYVERAPTGYELFSQGPHDATATFEIGDPTLRLERARTVEISLRRGKGRCASTPPATSRATPASSSSATPAIAATTTSPPAAPATNCARSSTRRPTPPSPAPRSGRSSTFSRSATAGPGSRRSTISSAPSSTTGATSRASRRTGSAAAPSCAPTAGSRASTCSTPSTTPRSPRSRRRRRAGTTCGPNSPTRRRSTRRSTAPPR